MLQRSVTEIRKSRKGRFLESINSAIHPSSFEDILNSSEMDGSITQNLGDPGASLIFCYILGSTI
jgi:hypothetical protein